MSLPLILASASARRRKILEAAGLTFEVHDPGAAEAAVPLAPDPESWAIAKARAKAHGVAAVLQVALPTLVVGADTLVVLGGEVLGKPRDRHDAERILQRLSGTRHRVITGLCLWLERPNSGVHPFPQGGSEPVEAAETSWVTLRSMGAAEIQAYVASGEANGKAGAYAIQESGDRFVERVEGSFLNVVGFPMERFRQLLPEALQLWKIG